MFRKPLPFLYNRIETRENPLNPPHPRSIKSVAWLLIALLFTATSCGLFHHATAGDDSLPRKRTARYLLKKLNQLQPEADQLSAKLKIDAQLPDQSIKLTGYLRMKRDSAIWMNFKKFGIELARVLITPDSILIINRLERSYFAERLALSLPVAERQTGPAERLVLSPAERLTDVGDALQIPLDFQQLQNLFWGYPPATAEVKTALAPGAYLLVNQRNDISDTLYLNPATFLPEKWVVNHPNSGLKAQMSFDHYQKVDKQHFFSYFRVLETVGKPEEEVQIALEFTKLELDKEVNMPFRIPDHYKRTR